MENEKLKASCPVCGRNLFRGSENSCVDAYCPKCGSHIETVFLTAGVVSTVICDSHSGKENIERQNHT